MINVNVLAFARAWQRLLMPDTCTLRVVTLSSDGSGGWTEGTADTTAVPCRLSLDGGAEAIQRYAMTAQHSYTLTIPSTYSINPKDRVVFSGDEYEVVAVNLDVSNRTATRVTLTRAVGT